MILFVVGHFPFCIFNTCGNTVSLPALVPRTIKFAGLFLAAIGISNDCFKQIDAGQVGVQTLFGKVQPGILEGGLHFYKPVARSSDDGCENPELYHVSYFIRRR